MIRYLRLPQPVSDHGEDYGLPHRGMAADIARRSMRVTVAARVWKICWPGSSGPSLRARAAVRVRAADV